MSKKQYAVAIDGPSGAGKSTLARAAAERLGILYVDTGAIYRTIGLYVQRRGIDPKDTAAVLAALPDIRIGMDHDADGMQRMLLNGEDVTADIRLPEISMYASAVSAIQGVRDFLMEMQRSLARERSVIMDGRDIGTVVLPDADVKIFLYADVEFGPSAASWSCGSAAHPSPTRRCCGRWRSGTTTTHTAPRRPCGRRTTPLWWTPAPWILTPALHCCWT